MTLTRGKYLSPFHGGHGLYTGWRWTWAFLAAYPNMKITVASDSWDDMVSSGLVLC